MTEPAKTVAFVAVAAVLLSIAIFTRPSPPEAPAEGKEGQSLFTDWKEPKAAKSIEITTINSSTNRPRELKVAEENGQWSIPSHGGFPANAEDHVIKAAQSIINLKILGVVSDAPGDHETYGVVEPSHDEFQPAPPGAGKMVVVRDGSGGALARLIIGKEDRAPAGTEGGSNLRFVRVAGQDRVYRVDLPADVFSSNFADWIDTDLLGLKQHWDITKFDVRDYALAQTDDGVVIDRKSDINLDFNDQKSAWTLAKLTDYKADKPTTTDKLPADDELDTQKLNDAKMNLSGLKIVDVIAKPKEFATKLKKNESYYGDDTALQSLGEVGMLASPREKPSDLFSAGGDTTVAMKDGVEYTIHYGVAEVSFGDKEESSKASADSKDAAKDGKKETEKKGPKAPKLTDKSGKKGEKGAETQRAVFVTARFNEDLVAKPVLEPPPTIKKTDDGKTDDKKPADGAKPDDKKAGDKTSDTKKIDVKNPGEPKPEADKAPPAAKSKNGANKSDENYAEDAPVVDQKPVDKQADDQASDKKPSVEANAKEKKPGEKTTDEKATAGTKSEGKSPPGKATDDKKSDGDKKLEVDKAPASGIKRAEDEEKLEAERKRVDAANKQKTDQYNDAIKKGKQHAKELNDRFAEWFYYISEEDYNKVHLTRTDILKKKPTVSTDKDPAPLGHVEPDPFQLPGKK